MCTLSYSDYALKTQPQITPFEKVVASLTNRITQIHKIMYQYLTHSLTHVQYMLYPGQSPRESGAILGTLEVQQE